MVFAGGDAGFGDPLRSVFAAGEGLRMYPLVWSWSLGVWLFNQAGIGQCADVRFMSRSAAPAAPAAPQVLQGFCK
jgi:hypothetical protein